MKSDSMFCVYSLVVLLLLLLQSSCVESFILKLERNETFPSPTNVFELGFVQPNVFISRWYLGIWLAQDPKRTCLWVANRDNALTTPMGTLTFSNNDLVLIGQGNKTVWSANLTGGGDVNSQMSFDNPTDTLLPNMRLGYDPKTGSRKVLKPWKNQTDPSSGYLSLRFEDDFYSAVVAISLGHPLSAKNWSIVWNGYSFGDMPPILEIENETLLVMTNYLGNHSRLTLEANQEESIGVYTWDLKSRVSKASWSLSKDDCHGYLRDVAGNYRTCGSYSFCSTTNKAPMCSCIQGFHQKTEPSGGCVRSRAFNCNDSKYLLLKNMKLPERHFDQYQLDGFETCKQFCHSDCACTAFALVEKLNNSYCVYWTGELDDMQKYSGFGGQQLYVRVAAKDLG
ncbi:S-locus-specific glycoprotein S13-like [Eutrema salsugineum]|uniref:S-locus-specific glycoprotein S13-like n=1 Tax=Eutrema salsugineum TaxID=72664 RepID=UPI000CED084E|nr:S-locus-specific glycoprotein S13-like [Eutrema salsugineum]